MIDINKLTLGEIKEIQNTIGNNSSQKCPWVIGEKYFIRTVTMHLMGELILLNNKELVLKNASWIADSGRFHDFLRDGKLNEVEPFVSDVIINRDCIVDATRWNHELPKDQK